MYSKHFTVDQMRAATMEVYAAGPGPARDAASFLTCGAIASSIRAVCGPAPPLKVE